MTGNRNVKIEIFKTKTGYTVSRIRIIRTAINYCVSHVERVKKIRGDDLTATNVFDYICKFFEINPTKENRQCLRSKKNILVLHHHFSILYFDSIFLFFLFS